MVRGQKPEVGLVINIDGLRFYSISSHYIVAPSYKTHRRDDRRDDRQHFYSENVFTL